MRRENEPGTPFDYHGFTTRTMHDPARLRRQALALARDAAKALRMAVIFEERAREIERGEYARHDVPYVWDDDYPHGEEWSVLDKWWNPAETTIVYYREISWFGEKRVQVKRSEDGMWQFDEQAAVS